MRELPEKKEPSQSSLIPRTLWDKIKLLLAGALIGGISYAMVSKYFL